MSLSTKFLFTACALLSVNAFSMSSSECNSLWKDIEKNEGLESKYSSLKGLCGDRFKSALKKIAAPHKDLGYKGARKAFFSDIDNVDGEVCGVYTKKCLRTSGIPNSNVMNCEHSWPQSKGATGTAKSDIHHLYPSDSRMNSRRSNYPLCDVISASYEDFGSALGKSKFGTKCFEPPADHKGDVARSMFYFSVVYSKKIDSQQEEFFRKWNDEDQVSQKESKRNSAIERYQNNRNPFVDHPGFVALIEDY